MNSNQIVNIIVREGLTPYDEAHALQLETVNFRKSGQIPDTLILLEHPPVITLGRNADPKGVVASSDELKRRGVSVRHVERGGQTTFHGPGQLVCYPIVNLNALGIGIKRYVTNLEETMIQAAESFGVKADRRDGVVGIFCGQGKIGAVGVRITSNITFHGLALNVNPALDNYRLIIPCGLTDTPITSIAAVTNTRPSMIQAQQAVLEAFFKVFGFKVD
ncbi:MAG: lipoyl(octanoyl) transferase LipB [Proteobacteria bacterium]|nr:lipoyl(octanoyl) transferase LipB [Pseudomonadota bacterium]